MWNKSLKFRLLLTLQICTGLEERYKYLGRRCTDTRDCYGYDHYGNKETMKCADGRCQCNTPKYILVVENYVSNYGNVRGCNDAQLQTLLPSIYDWSPYMICQNSSLGKLCHCKEGMELHVSEIFPRGSCSSTTRVDFQQSCWNSKYCNYEKRLICNGGKCDCRGMDMYDFNTSECVRKATYMKNKNLYEYKVTHGVYCKSSDDCIIGLYCNGDNSSCTCPVECPYIKETQSCDCGEIVYKRPILPILVGVIIGILITGWWCKVTKHLIKSHFKEEDSTNEHEALPLRATDSKIAVAVESDYGTEVGLVRRAPLKVTQHPLETSEKTYQERYDKQRMTSAAQTFGIGFTLHLKHERAAASVPTIGHMPVLPRSNAHYQALTGKDLDIGFEDTLATDLEFSRTPHTIMEKLHERPLFK